MDDAFKTRLRAMANGSEDAWMERKPNAGRDGRDVRRTMVAFANSVSEREFAALFIGASDDLRHPGVQDPDELQKQVETIATKQCYPPIEYKAVQLELAVESRTVVVLAVVIPPSLLRPHFSGPSYVRRGSQSIEASSEMMNELLEERIDKVRALRRMRGMIKIRERSARGLHFEFDGTIKKVTPHNVEVMNDGGDFWDVPLKDVEIVSEEQPWKKIQIPIRSTEPEHIERMLSVWHFSQPPGPLAPSAVRDNYILRQLLPIAGEALPAMARMGWGKSPSGSVSRRIFEIFSGKITGVTSVLA